MEHLDAFNKPEELKMWKPDEKQDAYVVWRRDTPKGPRWLTLASDEVPKISTTGFTGRLDSIMDYVRRTYLNEAPSTVGNEV